MRQPEVRTKGIPVRAFFRGHASHAQAPQQFLTTPVGAVNKLLNKLNWSPESVDLYEINEGFAVGVLAVRQALAIPPERVNVHGGGEATAVALGLPKGAENV